MANPTVTCAMSWQEPWTLPGWNEPGVALAVTVTNASPVALPDVQVKWQHEYETTQPYVLPGRPQVSPDDGEPIPFEQTQDIVGETTGDTTISFAHEPRDVGRLPAGASREFWMDTRLMPLLRTMAASLSPERYRVVVLAGGREVARIDGREVGGFLERLDDSPPPVATKRATPFVRKLQRDPDQSRAANLHEQYPSVEAVILRVPNPNKQFSLALGSPGEDLMGKINDAPFLGREAGTLLHLGPRASSANPVVELVFLYRPEGWSGVETMPRDPADYGPLLELVTEDGR